MNDLLQVTDHHIQLTHRLLMSDAGQFLFQGWPIHRSIRMKLMTMSEYQRVIRHCKSKRVDQWNGINFRRSTNDGNRSDRGWYSAVPVLIRVANDFVWLRSDEPCVYDGIAIDEECVDHVRSVHTVWKDTVNLHAHRLTFVLLSIFLLLEHPSMMPSEQIIVVVLISLVIRRWFIDGFVFYFAPLRC